MTISKICFAPVKRYERLLASSAQVAKGGGREEGTTLLVLEVLFSAPKKVNECTKCCRGR